jgi:hypothetical protein
MGLLRVPGCFIAMRVLIDPRGSNIYRFPVAPNLAATDEIGSRPVVATIEDLVESKEAPRSFLKAARKDLTPEEAASTAGMRWLQYEADRLEQECGGVRAALDELRNAHDTLTDQYHDQRVEVANLRGTKHASVRNEILANLCLAAGAAGLGVAPGYFSIAGAAGLAYVGMVVSAVLVVGGISCRVWK